MAKLLSGSHPDPGRATNIPVLANATSPNPLHHNHRHDRRARRGSDPRPLRHPVFLNIHPAHYADYLHHLSAQELGLERRVGIELEVEAVDVRLSGDLLGHMPSLDGGLYHLAASGEPADWFMIMEWNTVFVNVLWLLSFKD